MTNRINALPALTWNHLHVNQASAAAALPQAPANGWGPSGTVYGTLPQGVSILPGIPEACKNIVSGAGEAVDSFVLQNANTGCALSVTGQAGAPLLITHTLTAECPAAIATLDIHAEAGSSLTVIEVVQGSDDIPGVSASLIRVCVEENAQVKVVQLQMLNPASRRWSALGGEQKDGARIELYRAELGGTLAVCGSLTRLSGRRSEYDTSTIYFGDGEAVLDFNDVAEHTGRETVSEIHAAGVLAGKCQKTLRGTIDFQRGAVHAVGHESEDVLLLSPDVRNRTAPLILCGEELVEGQHAATAGRLDENILYYMASRGLSEQEARRLMVEARYAPVLDQIPLANLRCDISDFIERRLDGCAGI